MLQSRNEATKKRERERRELSRFYRERYLEALIQAQLMGSRAILRWEITKIPTSMIRE